MSKTQILQRIDEILNNPLNMYNEDILKILKTKLNQKFPIFKISTPNREELKKSRNKILQKILKKKLSYDRHKENKETVQRKENSESIKINKIILVIKINFRL